MILHEGPLPLAPARDTLDSIGALEQIRERLRQALERAAAPFSDIAKLTRPAFRLASRFLPPALGMARTASSALVSGKATRELIELAADGAEAARKIMRRVEPPAVEIDGFGEDPSLLSRVEPGLDFLYERYFRVEVSGAEHVPRGACLVVCNHSGALPLDGLMVRAMLRRECLRPDARWLLEDTFSHAPFLGVWLSRLGAVRACPENAERLLAQGVALAVFPEGLLGISKPIGQRYQLQRFGRGGFVKLAMRTRTPVVPVAIVGAEEASPLLAKIRLRAMGLPYLPVTPTFPLLGPLGLLPLPTKWKISVLPVIDLGQHGAQGAEDPALVARCSAEIRDDLQRELERLTSERRSLFRG
jgi:1-acyl-sn-glycerol-3-phosphate acyltransferase